MPVSPPRHLSVVSSARGDDGLILTGVRQGKPEMADRLVRRAGPRARSAIKRLLPSWTSEHDDLVQLTLLELVGSIDSFHEECSLDTWIDRLAANVVYKRLRRASLERRLFDELTPEALEVAGRESSERRTLTLNVIDRVRDCLERVDDEKVATWVLFEVHGLTLEEVALAAEISVTAAQSRVSRARRAVREALEKDPELATLLEDWEMFR